jgi:alkane 1-monooxygenase
VGAGQFSIAASACVAWECGVKNLRDLGYVLGVVPGLLAITGNLAGSYWAAANLGLLALLWVGDSVCWENRKPPGRRSPAVPNVALALHWLVVTLAPLSLLYGVHSHILTGKFVWLAALSTGMNGGGFTLAHELIHRKSKICRYAGLGNLLLAVYGHWYIAHVCIHHKRVGTASDPATARYGESIYRFIPRAIMHNLILSLRWEAARVERGGRRAYGGSNIVVRLLAIELAGACAMMLLLGPLALLAFVVQAGIAVLFLEMINYMQHYGLERRPGDRVRPELSWHTDSILDHFMLLELNRHADHHQRASQPYHDLISYPQSPMLPFGYWVMGILMFIPPLWYRVMHPRIERLRKSHSPSATAAALRQAA